MSAGTALKQIVTFRVGNDLFAADIHAVDRVLRYVEPRRIPNLPGWMEGVTDYQSRVVPVVDLRRRFELPPMSQGAAARIVVFNCEGELIGGVVDEVLDVVSLASGAVSPPPALFRGLKAEYILGMTQRQEKLVVILDVARIFTTTERLALEAARAAGGDHG